MQTEYEGRILDISVQEVVEKLEKLGATKEGEYEQRRYVYDTKPVKDGRWIRLRTNGKTTTLTLKDIVSPLLDGTKELEITVEDFEKTHLLLQELGFSNRSYQENKRIRYRYQDVEIDIDTWPKIPTYIEIEGSDEASVKEMVKVLGYQEEDISTLDVEGIYEHYGYDIHSVKELKFEEEKK